MRWLIVEDSLKDRRGHWFEYLGGFHRALPLLGDHVTLLVAREAEAVVAQPLDARAVLPEGAILKMSDGASLWRRYARIPLHGWKTFWTLRRFVRRAPQIDVIFVPTVIVHHLLAWTALVKFELASLNTRLLLFFVGLPIRETGEGASCDGSPTSRVMARLLGWLEPEIRSGKVILGVETNAMKRAAEMVFNLPFVYFPHPVQAAGGLGRGGTCSEKPVSIITMACYGPARHEKGSDILAAAIAKYLARNPKTRVRFVLQWLEDFATESGQTARLPASLEGSYNVEIVKRFFDDGEYAMRLASTHVMLLPYRRSSYALRVSRVVIEAMNEGIPVVTTRGTTLAEQAEKYGAAVLCDENDVESLVAAVETVERNYEGLAAKALEMQGLAQRHFSVETFRSLLGCDSARSGSAL